MRSRPHRPDHARGGSGQLIGPFVLRLVLLGLFGTWMSSCDKSTGPASPAAVAPVQAAGTANEPTLDSISDSTWAKNTYDTTLHLHLSTITPGASIHYTVPSHAESPG